MIQPDNIPPWYWLIGVPLALAMAWLWDWRRRDRERAWREYRRARREGWE